MLIVYNLLCYAPHLLWGKAGRFMIGHVSGTVHGCSDDAYSKDESCFDSENFPWRIFDGMCLPMPMPMPILHSKLKARRLNGGSFRETPGPGEGAE